MRGGARKSIRVWRARQQLHQRSVLVQHDDEGDEPPRPTDKPSLTVCLSSMSYDVHERNHTISNMAPRLNAQPSTLRNLGTCRFCGAGLRHTFVDLGMSPPCEAILERAQLNQMEAFYP